MDRLTVCNALVLGLLSGQPAAPAHSNPSPAAIPDSSRPALAQARDAQAPGGFVVDDSAFPSRGDQTRRRSMVERVHRCILDNGLADRYSVDVFQAKTRDGTFVAEKIKTVPLPVKLLPDSATLAALKPEELDPESGVFSKTPFAYTAGQWTGEAVYFKFTPEAPSMAAALAPLPSFMPHQMSRPDLDLRTIQRAVDWSGSLGTLLGTVYDGRQVQSYSRMDSSKGMLNASTNQLTPGIWSLSVGAEFSGSRIWGGIVYPLIDGNGLARGKGDPLTASRQGPYQNRVECTLAPMFGNTLLPWVAPTPWPVDAIKGNSNGSTPAALLDANRGTETICVPERPLLDRGGWLVVRKGATWAPLQDDLRIDQSLDHIESALMIVIHESISDADMARVLRALSTSPPQPAEAERSK